MTEIFGERILYVKDYVIAYMWLNLAAACGKKEAAENRDVIARLMTPEQIGEGQKLAREWKPKTPEVIPTPKKYTQMAKEQWEDAFNKILQSTPKNQRQIACSLTKTTTIKPRVLHEMRRGCMRYLQFALPVRCRPLKVDKYPPAADQSPID
jgi:hypothetical protein